METKVYLSGSLILSDWQSEVIEKVGKEGYIYYNPREHMLADSRQYAIWDLYYVKNCDILFACMQKENPSGFGLTIELGYARALGKPIILVDEKSMHDEDFGNKFKIVRESASIVFDKLDDGSNFLINIRNGIIQL